MDANDPGERVLRDLGYSGKGRFWRDAFDYNCPTIVMHPADYVTVFGAGIDSVIYNGRNYVPSARIPDPPCEPGCSCGLWHDAIDLKRASDGSFRRGGDALEAE